MIKKINILRGDRAIWVLFFLLTVISLVSVYSTIGLTAYGSPGKTPLRLFMKHLAIVLATYASVIVLSHLKYTVFAKLSTWAYLLALVLVITAFIMGKMNPESVGSGEARWLGIGKMSFQPSEFVKLLLVIFVASTMSKNREMAGDKILFGLTIASIGAVVLFVAPENFSSAALIFLVCYIMLYFGGVDRKMWWTIFLVAVLAVVLYMGINYTKYKYQKTDQDTPVVENVDKPVGRGITWGHRIYSWLHPDPDEVTQENIARMAIARGGLFGKHVGSTIHGRLMKGSHNDFIYAIIIEETGMAGGLVVFILYAWLFLRCVRIAKRCEKRFGSLLVAGMGLMIYVQALLNMGVAVGALPVTGQTLPFISYGGSAYMFLGCGLGIIQAVAAETDTSRRKKKTVATIDVENIEGDQTEDIENKNN